MFENESIGYADKQIYNFCVQLLGVTLLRTEPNCETVEGAPHFFQRCLAKAFKDGAEFGYKYKCNEWHYLEDGKLPPFDTNVLIIHRWARTPEVGKRTKVFINSNEWVWSMCSDRFRYTSDNKDVIAWKEIVLPEPGLQMPMQEG